MFAEYEDLDNLLKLQKVDLTIMQLKKQRAELPQRIQVMRLRKKKDEIQAKLDQVLGLRAKADGEMAALRNEDRALAEKQDRAQELIDAAGSDYRKVESHSKELAGAAKHREELALKMVAVEDQLLKIQGVQEQLEGGIATATAEEARLRSAFESDDNALIEQVKVLNEKRAELREAMADDLVALYDKTAAHVGGVAVGKLEESTCGVCRTSIDGGRLIELRSQAPLGRCPNCKRLLVIE